MSAAIDNEINTLRTALPDKITPMGKAYKSCMKTCRLDCKNSGGKKNGEVCNLNICKDYCDPEGTLEIISPEAEAYNNLIAHYYNECSKSLGKGSQPCEETEAKAYCAGVKQINNLKKKKNWIYPVETQDDINQLHKFARIAENAWDKRKSDIASEVATHNSAVNALKTKCSKNHACELELSKLDTSMLINDYNSLLSDQVTFNRASEQMGCNSGCAPADCVPDRDDTATSKEGCYCDEFCMQAGDCCENFKTVCGPVLGLAALTTQNPLTGPFTPRR